MSSATIMLGTRTAIAGADTALNSLGAGMFIALGTITHAQGSKVPLDCAVELAAMPGTVSGNKQLILYAQPSLDGSTFSSGPVSGTTTTDEANLIYIGSLPLGTNAAQQRRVFYLAAAFGGNLPFATRLIVKNDSGATLAASGNEAFMQNVTGDIT